MITGKYFKKFGVRLDPESEVIVTIGSKERFSHMCLATMGAGETAIIPAPFFPAHMYAARPGRTYPELVVRMAAGERVEPHVGDFEAGMTFTRWFWQTELDADMARRDALVDELQRRTPPPPFLERLRAHQSGLAHQP